MKYNFLYLLMFFGFSSQGQDNHTITIDGKEFPIQMGESFTYITESGESIIFELGGPENPAPVPAAVQTTNQFENKGSETVFEDNMIRFNYPENFSVATTQPSEGLQQITMVSGAGGGIILQEFSTMNPKGLEEFFLSQLVGETHAANSQKANQTIDGNKVKGLRTTDEDGDPVVVYTHGKDNQGVVIALIGNQKNDALLIDFLRSLSFRF